MISEQLLTLEDEITVPSTPGEDIKEYMKDLGKVTGDTLKGFFRRAIQPDSPDENDKN